MNNEVDTKMESTEESNEILSLDGLCRELTMEEILLVSIGGGKATSMGA